MDPAALRAQLREYGIDLSKTGLHRLETTEPKNPNLKIIEAIAEITNVSPGWILFGKGPTVPETEVGSAIRSRVIDTIELMSGALDLTARQALAGATVEAGQRRSNRRRGRRARWHTTSRSRAPREQCTSSTPPRRMRSS